MQHFTTALAAVLQQWNFTALLVNSEELIAMVNVLLGAAESIFDVLKII